MKEAKASLTALWRGWLWIGKRLGEIYAAVLLTVLYVAIIGLYKATHLIVGGTDATVGWKQKHTDASIEAMRRQY